MTWQGLDANEWLAAVVGAVGRYADVPEPIAATVTIGGGGSVEDSVDFLLAPACRSCPRGPDLAENRATIGCDPEDDRTFACCDASRRCA